MRLGGIGRWIVPVGHGSRSRILVYFHLLLANLVDHEVITEPAA
jgi:hypothetical protein